MRKTDGLPRYHGNHAAIEHYRSDVMQGSMLSRKWALRKQMTPAESAQRMESLRHGLAQNPGLHGHLAWRNVPCMPIRMTHALIISVALLATGCSRMSDPDIKQNPHPVKRYEITMAIEGAPGPFDGVSGFMQYDISNEDCAPRDLVSQVRVTPIKSPPIVFTRVSDLTYTGTVFLDFLQDENYYDLGVCHWKMTAAIAALKIKGSGAEFSPDISFDEIAAQKPVTKYFAKQIFSDTNPSESAVGGAPMSETVSKYRSDYFSITLTAKENIP